MWRLGLGYRSGADIAGFEHQLLAIVVRNHYRKKILLVNGHCCSGQRRKSINREAIREKSKWICKIIFSRKERSSLHFCLKAVHCSTKKVLDLPHLIAFRSVGIRGRATSTAVSASAWPWAPTVLCCCQLILRALMLIEIACSSSSTCTRSCSCSSYPSPQNGRDQAGLVALWNSHRLQ